jgi:hypothetical protein
MRFPAWAAAAFLSACAFSSETPFFDLSAAAFPIADGARFDWIESAPHGERIDVAFRRTSGGYEMIEAAHPDEPTEILFVAVAETPEDDYIAQARIEPGEAARAYAFMWRAGDVYRVISNPGALEPGPKLVRSAELPCRWRSYHECGLASADDLMRLYRAALYPRFVAGDELPHRYSELVPRGSRVEQRVPK